MVSRHCVVAPKSPVIVALTVAEGARSFDLHVGSTGPVLIALPEGASRECAVARLWSRAQNTAHDHAGAVPARLGLELSINGLPPVVTFTAAEIVEGHYGIGVYVRFGEGVEVEEALSDLVPYNSMG